ncbi:hypothetical protein AAG94_21040 [Escherichia albertii]|nr:hypothetical protein [Escherichia albertii]EFO4720930.1 hypothetical protein [Escherichia albertii]
MEPSCLALSLSVSVFLIDRQNAMIIGLRLVIRMNKVIVMSYILPQVVLIMLTIRRLLLYMIARDLNMLKLSNWIIMM